MIWYKGTFLIVREGEKEATEKEIKYNFTKYKSSPTEIFVYKIQHWGIIDNEVTIILFISLQSCKDIKAHNMINDN